VALREFWRRLWALPDVVYPPNAECPLCGAGVVVASDTMRGRVLGPMMAVRPREELIAACVVHGRSPFNDRTVRYTASIDRSPPEDGAK
jgi:hypothetical protein